MTLLWYTPSVLITVLLAVGAGASFTQILPPDRGFRIFLGGLLLAAVALPGLGGAAAFASSTGRAWRARAVRAAWVPLLAVVGLMLPNLARVNPQIHDITTDAGGSLEFTPDVAALRSDALGESLPPEDVLAQQREHYADVKPLELAIPPDRAYALALQVAEQMPDWQVTARDSASGRIEAVATSRLFHFKDDVLIRAQPAETGSRLDMRSRSRIGRSDFGANAARIRAYLQRVQDSAR